MAGPVQAAVLTITDNQQEFAAKIVSTLKSHGFRVEADLRNEKIGFKIREAENSRFPTCWWSGTRKCKAAWWQFADGAAPTMGACRSNSSWNSFARIRIRHYAAHQPSHKRGDLSSLNYV